MRRTDNENDLQHRRVSRDVNTRSPLVNEQKIADRSSRMAATGHFVAAGLGCAVFWVIQAVMRSISW